MIFKWILTVPTILLITVAVPWFGPIGPLIIAACGVFMSLLWTPHIGGAMIRPLTDLIDGGNLPPDPRPAYSMAQAKQKKGMYLEAISDIRNQLNKFPTDFEGHMLLAQIQVEDLKDLQGAELTLQRFCAQPGHAPKNITFALFSVADWQLKYGQDREAAQRALEQIIALLPETEFALTAAQRIAHLANAQMVLSPHERKKFTVHEGPRNLGLVRAAEPIKPLEKDPAQQAADYVKHLEKYPLDAEAREQLAILYVDHYGRMDLAADQLEQLIQQPHRPNKLIVRWLNMLADLQVRAGMDYETIRQTLERIVELDLNHSAADHARKRIDLLKLELKSKQKTEAVKMGTYEQKLGLKWGGGPRPPG
jgi:tetratricopeptide (TPR) repeat protein